MLSKSTVKYIQSLGHKKFRDEEGVFIAEGPKLVGELVNEKITGIREVYATQKWISEHPDMKGIPIVEVSEDELRKISSQPAPNEVLAVIRKFDPGTPEVSGITLALDTIQDPGNLGTIIRIADWFGVSEIVCNKGCADLYNPKVVQSTMGSIARLNVHYTDLVQWITSQKDTRVYATMLEGQDIRTVNKLQKGIILIGNESRGIDPALLSLANIRITIPRIGRAESLNAAVATGIILSHLL